MLEEILKAMEGKTVLKAEVAKNVTVFARNFPTEDKPMHLRLIFTDGSTADIMLNGRGYHGDFTYFLELSQGVVQ